MELLLARMSLHVKSHSMVCSNFGSDIDSKSLAKQRFMKFQTIIAGYFLVKIIEMQTGGMLLTLLQHDIACMCQLSDFIRKLRSSRCRMVPPHQAYFGKAYAPQIGGLALSNTLHSRNSMPIQLNSSYYG